MTVKRKGSALKRVLATALRQNRRLPLFVVAKTARKLTQNPKRRHWKRDKMKVKAERTVFRGKS
jgi:large subunit ribosomal protein L39e